MMRTTLLVALPALAAAKLNSCRGQPTLRTGVDDETPGVISGGPLNSNIPLYLKYDCDLMYKPLDYSGSGIPCGSSSTQACVAGPNISFPNYFYPPGAIDALAMAVQDRLGRGADNSAAGSLLDTQELELMVSVPTRMNMTFLSEGACDRNSVGITRFPQSAVDTGDPRDMTFRERRDIIRDVLNFDVVFPNVDLEFCRCDAPGTPDGYDGFCTETNPVLARGTTMQLLSDFRSELNPNSLFFEPGQFVTFFLIDDGFDNGFSPGGDYNAMAEEIIFATPELNNPDMVRQTGTGGPDLRQHAFVFKGFAEVEDLSDGTVHDFSDEVFFCFEDRLRFRDGGAHTDNDFEDLCFFISSDPPLGGFEPSAAPTGIASEMPTTVDGSDAPSMGICAMGILSECGNVCCAASCGACGGCDCAERAPGPEACCPHAILFSGIACSSSTEVGCVVDFDTVCSEDGSDCDNA